MLSHAVAADDRESYLQLAASYENGRGVKKDYREAFRLYCLAARNGEEEAYYSLGWMYFNGRGVPRDMTLAAGWFSKGADAGDRTAANILKKLGNVEPREDLSCPPLLAGKSSDRELIERWVHLLAPEYQLDPELVLAVITAESNFNPKARSPKGALGLMQLIPETAKRFGVKDPLDPLQNLRGGMAYLRWLLDYFDSNVALALAGYNAGEKAVDRHKGIPPYRETRNYVRRITRNLKKTSAVSTGVRLRGS
ncbi:MAG: lytic transglycosylase [Gammaproteobacteria bacterium]|nr:MAG: lytic transglycosylase [Gammaproteobacteria bacterium]RTZ72055.1 MAG: lytic transglycosylase [Gammaproteobacteria bacterium]